jgi:molecular chaperone GrpE
MSKDRKMKTNESNTAPADSITVEESYSQSAVESELGMTSTPELSGAPPLLDEEQLRVRVAELEDRLLRSMADLDNFRKRTARQFDEVARSTSDKIFGELLDVVTNLDRALQHCKDGADIASLRQGMEMIHGQFMGLLTRNEIRPIEALGQPFDPRFHEALMQVDSAEYPPQVVAAEISKGYMQGDRVLRHTQVAVSRGPAADSNKKDDK